MIAERILTQVVRHRINNLLHLEWGDIPALPQAVVGRRYMLYVHVPFCEVLCPYCSFNRFLFNESLARNYFECLRQEMRMVADLGYRFDSMYIGGGTPTMLIDELIKTIDLGLALFSLQEISCETNPNHLTDTIAGMLQGRVQRLSLGVQSFDDDLLKRVSRYDRFGSGKEIFERIQAFSGKFHTFNIDLIFNFPGQTRAGIRRDAEMVLASGANQVSCYPLMAAPSVKKAIHKQIGRLDHANEFRLYETLSDRLMEDFEPTSAWTFSRSKGEMIDEYISTYEEYAGIGSGSFSYLDGSLYVNTFSPRQYQDAISAGRMSVAARRTFDLKERMSYRFMMELFGLSLDRLKFKMDFGLPVERGLWLEYLFMNLSGAIDTSDRYQVRLTPRGRYLELVMMREFFSALDSVREQARMALSQDERSQLICQDKIIPHAGDPVPLPGSKKPPQ